jgi:hypothetical protein
MQGGILYVKPYFDIGAVNSVNETPTAITNSGFTPIFTTGSGQKIGGTFILGNSNAQPLTLGSSLLNDAKFKIVSTLRAFNNDEITRQAAINEYDKQSLQIAVLCQNTANC